MTPRNVRAELKSTIKQAQNFNTKYMEAVSVGLPTHSSIYYPSQIIKSFEKKHPSVSVSLVFSYDHSTEQFLKGETDIVFTQKENVKRIPDIQVYPFYESPIYLISQRMARWQKKDLSL